MKLITSKVLKNNKLNSKFNLIELKFENGIKNFKPGQFVTIKVSNETFRPYTIFTHPNRLPNWEIFVDITPGGPGSTYLSKLKKGDLIQSTKPVGNFYINKDGYKNFVFGVTGCGFAAARPMIEELLEKKKNVYLFWGLRFEKDIVFKKYLRDLKKKHNNFDYQISLSKPNKSWKGIRGYVPRHVHATAKDIPAKDTGIYLCGNGSMIESSIKHLIKNRFPKEHIFTENCIV